MQSLKNRWGISSSRQLGVIFVIFAITGSASVYVAKPVLDLLGIHQSNFPDAWWGAWLYWILRLSLIFPFYQIFLLLFAWIFGQFRFFWDIEKKLLRRLGLSFIFRDS
jgi:hypothetical protein